MLLVSVGYSVLHVLAGSYQCVTCCLQARIRGLQWRHRIMEKKRVTQISISITPDSANKAKTIIEGVTVSEGRGEEGGSL